MAEKIVGVHGEDKEGVILRYDKPTGNWVPVEKNGLSGWRVLLQKLEMSP